MAPVGRTLLILALLIAGYGIVASLYGARSGRREWVDSGRRAVYALAGVTTVAWVILRLAVTGLKASYGSKSMPAEEYVYRPLRRGRDGSLRPRGRG